MAGISKSNELKKIIYDILSDNEMHTVSEIKNRGKDINSNLDWDKDLFNTVLYQMKNKDPAVINSPKGVYRLLKKDELMKKEVENMKRVSELLAEVNALCDRFEESLMRKNYLDVEVSEYVKAKEEYRDCMELRNFVKKLMNRKSELNN